MKILKKLFNSNDTKVHVDEIAMLMGGIPTLLSSAVIVESGSNANGRYVKFGDGTMICTTECLSGQNPTGDGFALPSAFTDTTYKIFPIASGFVSGSFSYSYGCEVGKVSTNTFRLKVFVYGPNGPSSAPTGTVVMIIAIGRWK